jgi:hypothetical protein
MPLLFGIQQILDGIVWLSFGTPPLHTLTTYAYALFAFVFWPIFTPLAILALETHQWRKGILKALSFVGLGVGVFFLYFILFGTVTAQIVNHCVAYATPHPYGFGILAFYLVATCGSFFVSSRRILNIFGIILLISFAIAGWFYFEAFTSVWCFFAAILSGIIYWHFQSRPGR